MVPRQIRPPDARLFKALYDLGLGPLVGKFVLVLTTTGRKSGLPRMTALQYEVLDGNILVASAKGTRSDWFRNIIANPCVKVRVKSLTLEGTAEPITDPEQIADFLELRLKRHPRMVGAILQSEGLTARPHRPELVDYARKLALVIIHPVHPGPK